MILPRGLDANAVLSLLAALAYAISAANLRPDMPEVLAALRAQGGAYTLETVSPAGEYRYQRIESIRAAQKKYGNRVVTGDEVQYGAEHLTIDAARIKALGVDGMMQPVKTSCADHGGVHMARIHTWDGGEWSYTSDWYKSESGVLNPMIKSSAEKYAAEKKITPTDCAKAS